jgi:hypothetical protein
LLIIACKITFLLAFLFPEIISIVSRLVDVSDRTFWFHDSCFIF